MKLLRLKITDLNGFRSLPAGFEHYFRTEWTLQNESDEFVPFVCAGPNGSGKSNLLEALAAIFFQLEVQRVRRNFLPKSFLFDPDDNPEGMKESDGTPNAFELEYLIKLDLNALPEKDRYAHVLITKTPKTSPHMRWLNPENFASLSENISADGMCTEHERDFLLPEYVLGYSSGENEILSLPFFKMRFVQFDEYWNCLKEQLPYPGRPETRLAYLDNSFSQAILLCNLLLQDASTLKPFREDIGIEELREFRIIIKRSFTVSDEVAEGFGEDNPALSLDEKSGLGKINLMQLLEASSESATHFDPIVTRLKRCATCWFVDEATDTLVLDYYVNEATKEAFKKNFDYAFYKSPLALFQAFQVLLTLNLYTVSETLKDDLYKSNNHYVSETVPTLASDERIMRFQDVYFTKRGVQKPMLLKELSDGEHQLLHSLGLCVLFKNTNCLFLLDEPETHFNPNWRANFITRLRECLLIKADKSTEENKSVTQEMLITTHTPFLISDSKPEKVLVFAKDKTTGKISISPPGYNTSGASVDQITILTFNKKETIGGYAEEKIKEFQQRFEAGENRNYLIKEINKELGNSIEKKMLILNILGNIEEKESF